MVSPSVTSCCRASTSFVRREISTPAPVALVVAELSCCRCAEQVAAQVGQHPLAGVAHLVRTAPWVTTADQAETARYAVTIHASAVRSPGTMASSIATFARYGAGESRRRLSTSMATMPTVARFRYGRT